MSQCNRLTKIANKCPVNKKRAAVTREWLESEVNKCWSWCTEIIGSDTNTSLWRISSAIGSPKAATVWHRQHNAGVRWRVRRRSAGRQRPQSFRGLASRVEVTAATSRRYYKATSVNPFGTCPFAEYVERRFRLKEVLMDHISLKRVRRVFTQQKRLPHLLPRLTCRRRWPHRHPRGFHWRAARAEPSSYSANLLIWHRCRQKQVHEHRLE